MNKMKQNEFLKLVKTIKENIEKIENNNIDINFKTNLSEYKNAKKNYISDMYKNNLAKLQSLINNPTIPSRVNELLRLLSVNDIENNKKIILELETFDDIQINPQKAIIKINKIPEEIRNEIKADLDEIDKCYNNGCYRSCVILCGRIIEVCLHARYFKETGIDILDKNPGIGLGKLIAKMDEKGIKLEPGLTQQIHLVNNVRIFSVHKKQRTFIPGKQQTEAIILYTFDVIDKMF
jgi:glutathionyl-hydroquinone reductase